MKYSLDTNVIISHLKADKFSDDTDMFFAWVRGFGHKIYIADIVYAELYTGVYLSQNPVLEEERIQKFLFVNNIEVISLSLGISKRAGELYAEHLLKNRKKVFKRILPDFMIGAHAEQYSDIFVTWNPSDYQITIPVRTPVEVTEYRN